ncbi:MAG: 3-deoxy-D-manno-octulosonate 8-phosphate phosphatase [Bacteroidota bacterium]
MNELESFGEVDTLIFDVDGVLTDGTLLVTGAGELLRKMSVRDGYALKHAHRAGYRVAIITGGKSEGVVKRLKNLGITDVFYGVQDKLAIYEEYLRINGIDSMGEGRILYMGDDMPDLTVMRRVGLPCCPHDAAPEIVGLSKYVSKFTGGAGCARDVIEKVMKVQGMWG